jgi:lipopolysaccharide heptosyltransferase II
MAAGWARGMSGESSAWSEVRRILCVRTDNIGDVLMTTPALRALRAALPDRHLTLLGSRAAASLAPHLPEVDTWIEHDAGWAKHANSDDELALAARIAGEHFDAAVIFTTCTQSALPAAMLCKLAGIPLRLAYCRENPYQLLSHWQRETDVIGNGMRHEVRRQLDLVATVGATASNESLSFDLRPCDHEGFRAAAADIGLDPTCDWVLIHPGASAASRRYPPESFACVVQRLHQHGLHVVFGGSPNERDLVETIRAQALVPTHSLAGRLTLGEYAAAISAAPLLLSCNSAPAHIAAAVGTPVVVPYALTNPQHTPWQVAHRALWFDVPCRNCLQSRCPHPHHACLRQLTPERVAAAALDLLADSRPAIAHAA